MGRTHHYYLFPPSLLIAFTRASFVQRPNPNPIIRSPFAAGAKAAIYFARGAELQDENNKVHIEDLDAIVINSRYPELST